MKQIGRTGMSALAGFGVAAGVGWVAMFGGASHLTAAAPLGAPAAASLAVDSAAVSSQPVTTGCNQLTYTNLPPSGMVGTWVTANVAPASAAVSIWHFDNASQHYKAMWFSNPQVPVDQATFTSAIDSFFLCVNANATAP